MKDVELRIEFKGQSVLEVGFDNVEKATKAWEDFADYASSTGDTKIKLYRMFFDDKGMYSSEKEIEEIF